MVPSLFILTMLMPVQPQESYGPAILRPAVVVTHEPEYSEALDAEPLEMVSNPEPKTPSQTTPQSPALKPAKVLAPKPSKRSGRR